MAILLKSVLQNQAFPRFLRNPQSVSPLFTSRTLVSSTEDPRKPLSVLFEEAVGLRPRSETSEIGDEDNELKKQLFELERTLVDLKKSEPAKDKREKKVAKPKEIEERKSLSSLFRGDKSNEQKGEDGDQKQEERIRVFKELPLEMISFVKLLHKEGYLDRANFLRGEKLDVGSFDDEYARTFLKFAAERFARDHQEIAKWLSGSDLKSIVLFGCPSLERRSLFSAKTLRKFFEIPENNVCDKCMIKDKCKFPNQSVWKGNTKNLHLSVVMKVIAIYSLDLTHPDLQVPEEIHGSVLRLLMEIQNLSKTVSKCLV
ncbi:PREDICTED: uncharacterized protein LOC104810427 [Tarenaya hassleriana]|uniref:uncharacterized protein LOC104810427 n=1 Tax=Tarenaya hassleriana TaxID=28532 RepID=UPI00053C3EE2|nr:PREDICTED: uncharacterized protein LOC104810427 [Tarenaya hassleriana]